MTGNDGTNTGLKTKDGSEGETRAMNGNGGSAGRTAGADPRITAR